NFQPLLNTGDPAPPVATVDNPLLPDVSWGVAVGDDWVYVAYDNGFVRAFSNGRNILTGGGGVFVPPHTPAFFTGARGAGQPGARNEVAKPSVRALLSNTPQTGPWQPGAELTEDQLVFEWGSDILVGADFGASPDPRQTNTPLKVTLRGPIGGAITTTATL